MLRRLSRLGLLLVCAGATVLALAAQNASAVPADILPLQDVKAGMTGVGKTVFRGNQIQEFQVKILGVVHNMGPKQAVILARLSGGPLAQTGVLEGMSGSPVYIDGKLVGAVALGFPYAKTAIAGI
ncbi:MAG: SpoIVB peptidase S55 domain-containing protein, partial [Terriglobales bacterium]